MLNLDNQYLLTLFMLAPIICILKKELLAIYKLSLYSVNIYQAQYLFIRIYYQAWAQYWSKHDEYPRGCETHGLLQIFGEFDRIGTVNHCNCRKIFISFSIYYLLPRNCHLWWYFSLKEKIFFSFSIAVDISLFHNVVSLEPLTILMVDTV